MKRKQLIKLLKQGAAVKGEVTLSFDLSAEEKREVVSQPKPDVVQKQAPPRATPPTHKKRKKSMRLSEEQVWDVRDYLKLGKSDAEISKLTGIPVLTIWRIKNGKAYRRVPERPHLSTRKPTTVHVGHGEVKQ